MNQRKMKRKTKKHIESETYKTYNSELNKMIR